VTAVAEVSQARPLMPVEQALEQLLALAEAAPIRETENLPLAEAEGRVLATDLVASLDLPPWPNSAMDGYALRLADWQGQPLQPADQQPAVAVVDLPGPERQAWLDQFVAGRQHRHFHLAHHVQTAMPQGRRQAQFDRPKAGAGAHHLLAPAGFLALRAYVLLGAQHVEKAHPAIFEHFGVFLHLDAVGTFGQRCC